MKLLNDEKFVTIFKVVFQLDCDEDICAVRSDILGLFDLGDLETMAPQA